MTTPHEGPAMSPADFQAWLEHMELSERKAALALGIARNTVARCLKEGAPQTVALACAALAAGLEPWSPTVELVDWDERETLVQAIYKAPSLAALYVAVTAYDEWHGRNHLLDDAVGANEPDWLRLPTFGGERPETDALDVDTPVSWDERAVLYRTKGPSPTQWMLTAREAERIEE